MYTIDEQNGMDDIDLVRHYADEIEHLQKLAKEQPAFAKICQEEIKELEKNYSSMTLSGKNVGALVKEELQGRQEKNQVTDEIKQVKTEVKEPKEEKIDKAKVASIVEAIRPKKKQIEKVANI